MSKQPIHLNEKHVSFRKREENAYVIKIDKKILHLMKKKHYIDWVKLVAHGDTCKKFLKPGDKPETTEGKEIYTK